MKITLDLTRAREADKAYAFRFEDQEYIVRRDDGRVGAARFPWTAELLERLRSLRDPDIGPEFTQRVGDGLQEFVAAAGWDLDAIEDAVARGEPVLVDVRSTAAELYMLPWELLTMPGSGRNLGALPGVLLRYTWPGLDAPPLVGEPRDERGGVLVAYAEHPAMEVPHAAHVDAIARAYARVYERVGAPFDPRDVAEGGDVLKNMSVESLAETLERAAAGARRRVDVLHVLCHGVRVGAGYGLALRGPGGEGLDAVDAIRLRELLAPHAGRVRAVVLCACDSAAAGAPGDHLGGVAVNLHRAGLESVVASRLPLSVAGSTVFTRALYSELLGGPCSLEQAFVGARQALMRVSDARDWASVQLYARPGGGDDTRPLVLRPYRGLLPFRAIDTRLFYGREAERREIVADLEALREAGRPRLLVIAGASGTGKSSLVHAGAIPDLMGEQGDEDDASEDVDHLRRAALHHVESLVRVTGDEGFARALAELRQPARAPLRVTGAWVTITIRPGAAPVETLERALAAHVDTGRALLLVVDQFEELFTQTTSADQRGRFARRLWSLAQGDDLVHVVLTIRVDFLGRCGELVLDDAGARLDRVAYDEAHRVFIAQMQPAQLQTAIEAPAERVGLRLQQGLARRMLADVGGEPGALPLLQYTLFLLWQRRRGRTLELATYEALGGVVGALERRADELLDALDEREARQARRLFVNLVAVTDTHTLDTRRRVALRDLRAREPGAEDAFDQVVARFVDARLLVRGEERDEPIVEVAHEALLRRWTRLRGWLMEDRDKLAALREVESWAAPWPKHKPLLVGDQLAIAVSVRDRYPHDVSAKVHEMVDASARAEEARARRQRRRGRVVLLSIAAFAVMMAASTALIYRWYRNAQELERAEGVARGRAELAREDTLDALYLGTARLFAEDATEMAAWLREVKRPAKLRGWVALANDALQQPIAREVLTPGAREVQVSDDLDRLLSRGASGRFAAVVQGDGSTRVWPLPGLAEDDRLALSRDGGRVLITPRRGDELVSVLLDAERRARLPEVDTSTALRHPDGVRVLVRARGRDDEWLVWDSERGEITRRLEVPAPSRWARFLEGGARALAVSDAGYTIWSIEQDAPPLRVPGRPCAAGDRLVIVSVVEQGRETALVHRVTPDADVSAPVARDSDRAPVVSCAVLDDAHEHVLVTRADGRAQLRPVSELGGFTRTLAGAPKSFAPFARLIDSKLVLGSVALARVKGEDPSLYELRLYDLSRGASLSQPVEERVLECSARPFALEGAIVCPGDDTVSLWRVRDRATRVERLPGHLLDRRDGELLDLVVSDGNHATLYASRFPPGVPGVPLHAGGPPRSLAGPEGAARVVTSSTAALRVWPDTGVSALSLRRSSACPLRSLVFSQEAPARLWIGGCPGEPVTRWSVETGAAERDTSFAARLSPRGDWALDLTVEQEAVLVRLGQAPLLLRGGRARASQPLQTVDRWVFSADGRYLAVDGIVWEREGDGRPVVEVAGGWQPLLAGRHHAVVRDDAIELRALTRPDAPPVRLELEQGRSPELLALAPDGSRVVASLGDVVRVWSVQDGRAAPPIELPAPAAVRVAVLAQGGRRLYARGEAPTWLRAQLDDAAPTLERTLEQVMATDERDGQRRVAVLDRAGLNLVVSTGDDSVRVTEDARVVAALLGEDGSIATATERGRLRVWDARGRLRESLQYAARPDVWRFDADGSRLAVWSAEEPATVRVFELDAGRLERALWRATSLCPSIERRVKYLGASTLVATADVLRCRERAGRLVDPYQHARAIRLAGERASEELRPLDDLAAAPRPASSGGDNPAAETTSPSDEDGPAPPASRSGEPDAPPPAASSPKSRDERRDPPRKRPPGYATKTSY